MGTCGIARGLVTRRLTGAALSLVLVAGALAGQRGDRPRERGSRDGPSGGFLSQVRYRAAKSIDRTFGADAPMARALLIADQHRIPPEMRDRYARAGLVHMLSISGLHVAIIAGSVVLLLQALRIPGGIASLLAVMLTMAYVLVIGAPAPALRSAIMLAGVAASRATQRPTSPWAGLAIGALVPLISPRTALDLGYQLSVVGIAGLIASASLSRRLLDQRLAGWKLRIAKDMLTSAVATIITAPIIAWYFGRVSLIAPLSNVVAGPVVSILQPLLFLALTFAPLEPIGRFFADAAHPLLGVFDATASLAASIPGGSIAVIPTLVTAVTGGAAVILLTVASVSRYPARPLVGASACLCAVVLSPALPLPYSGGVEMHVLDVGQGDAILLRTDRGKWIIFDAGRAWKSGDAGRSTIIPYVKARGGRVAAFVLSHAHADHVGGAVSVLRGLEPDEFWDSAFPQGSAIYDRTLRAARDAGVEWNRVHSGDAISVDKVAVKFLAPDSAWTAALADPNDASTIALVTFGSSRFLLVGDAEEEEERWLLDRMRSDLRADVLKVGHHGSSTSSTDAFVAAVSPSLAVISVGADNAYGHPSADVLAVLGRAGARILRTDESGTIVIRSDGSDISVRAAGEEWDLSRR